MADRDDVAAHKAAIANNRPNGLIARAERGRPGSGTGRAQFLSVRSDALAGDLSSLVRQKSVGIRIVDVDRERAREGHAV